MGSRRSISQQFRTPANLESRIKLHTRYSTNKYGWHRWVFDQFTLPPDARILEVGCGNGRLWTENADRLPEGWRLLLTDYSEAMVRQSRHNLAGSDGLFSFVGADVEALPLRVSQGYGVREGDHCFDAVVASHMFYYVDDKEKALANIRRLLKPGGRFYATTNGLAHMRELNSLISSYDHTIGFAGSLVGNFTLENGPGMLAQRFDAVEVYRYQDSLVVTDLFDLLGYILSASTIQDLSALRKAALRDYIRDQFYANQCVINISKDAGMICGTVLA